MSRYTIWVCPVCRDQTEESKYEWRSCYHEELGGYVDPVEVHVQPEDLEQAINDPEVQDRVAIMARRHATNEAMWEWWNSLPQEEKDRREEDRRAAMTPWERALEDETRRKMEDLRKEFDRSLLTKIARPRA